MPTRNKCKSKMTKYTTTVKTNAFIWNQTEKEDVSIQNNNENKYAKPILYDLF